MEDDTPSTDIEPPQPLDFDPRICKNFIHNSCKFGKSCRYKHTFTIKSSSCKYFTYHGFCNNGSEFHYLHQRYFHTNTQITKHTSATKPKDCVFYDQGFCKLGKKCRFRHARKQLCTETLINGICSISQCRNTHLPSTSTQFYLTWIFEEYLKNSYNKQHPNRGQVPYTDVYTLCTHCLHFGHHQHECKIQL